MIVDIAGTRIDWASIDEWGDRITEEGGKLRPSTEHYGRLQDLYRSLTSSGSVAAPIGPASSAPRACSTSVAATRYRRIMASPRSCRVRRWARCSSSSATGSGRWSRAAPSHLAPKGPRLEPALLTDEALERLIHKHPERALVDRLRTEREFRANSP